MSSPRAAQRRLLMVAAPLAIAAVSAAAGAQPAPQAAPISAEPAPPPPAQAAPPASAPPPGEAETAPPPAPREPPKEIEVTVIGSRADALQRVPGSGTVITSEQIRRAQPHEVGDMLGRVPGVSVRQGIDGGNRMDLSVRGLDAPRGRRVLILEDGVPLAVNPYGEPDMYFAPPIERMRAIEVVKGSGSILFGPQTIGAVMNFLTLTPPQRRTVTLEAEGGAPAYMKLLGAYGDSIGDDVRFLGQVITERGVGFREEDFLATDVLAKVAFSTGDLGQATVKIGFHDEIAHTSQAGLTRQMFADDPERPTLSPYDRMAIRRYEASLIHEVAVAPETQLRTLVFAYTTSRIWRNQDYERAAVPGKHYERIVGDPRVPNGALFFEDSTTIPDRTFDVAGIEPRLEHRFSTAGIDHVLHLGARFLGETAERASRRGETKLSYAGALESYETSRTYAFAVYLQDKIAFTDFLVATPGVRFESAHQQRHIQRAFVEGEPRDVSLEGSSDITEAIPGIGAILGSKHNHAFGGVHVGFAPPRLTSAIDASGIDAQLDAERSINYETGGRTRPLPWLRFELTGFLSSYRNQIIPAPSGEGRLELKNAGETRHFGTETAARAAIGEALRLPLTIDLSGQYTLSRAVFASGDTEGNALPYAPLHTAGGALDIAHPNGLGGQLAVTYVGEQFSDEENTVLEDAAGRVGVIEDRAVVDLAARYRHALTGLTASVSVKNLFDAAYVASRRPDGIFPGAFRQVFFGLRWDWELERAEQPAPGEATPTP